MASDGGVEVCGVTRRRVVTFFNGLRNPGRTADDESRSCDKVARHPFGVCDFGAGVAALDARDRAAYRRETVIEHLGVRLEGGRVRLIRCGERVSNRISDSRQLRCVVPDVWVR